MEREVLAYLAGVIDSDGSIGIKRSTYAMRVRGDAGQPVYSEVIHCKQVQPQAVELLKATFGGNLHLQAPSLVRGKPLWSWSIHSAAAGRALALLLPFLRIKREQAANALALRAMMGQGRRWPVPEITDREPLITATEFAEQVGADRTSILQACRLGSVPSVKIGRSRMMPVSYLPAYAARIGKHGPPRDAVTSDRMESLYQRAKELNHVGI